MAAKLRIFPALADPFDVPVLYTATIGRTGENTVCLPASPTVSRQHAVIRCHNGYEYQLIDLGSRNGTYVNDQRVVMPVTLRHGARIRIADNKLVFELEDTPETVVETADVTVAGSLTPANQSVQSAAILVCDIRGFSAQSEVLSSDQLAHLLGHWFRDAGNLVQGSGGIIDKFIGDAVLAYWQEAADEPGKGCVAAYEAARQLLARAGKMRWPHSERPWRVGAALHYGRVTFGNIGLVAQRDATIIGNAVNTAFRLESVMKELNQDLLLSEQIVEALPDRTAFVDLGETTLKGKSETVRVFGLRPEPSTGTRCD